MRTCLRNRLIVRHADLVNQVAQQHWRRHTGLHAYHELDDLIQEGHFGLLDAVEHYDPCNCASFPTFAKLCIARRLAKLGRHEVIPTVGDLA